MKTFFAFSILGLLALCVEQISAYAVPLNPRSVSLVSFVLILATPIPFYPGKLPPPRTIQIMIYSPQPLAELTIDLQKPLRFRPSPLKPLLFLATLPVGVPTIPPSVLVTIIHLALWMILPLGVEEETIRLPMELTTQLGAVHQLARVLQVAVRPVPPMAAESPVNQT